MPIQSVRAPAAWLVGLASALGLCTVLAAAPQGGGAQRVPGKVTFIEAPSSERPEARSKRLKRECKGRPNAGACLGHAH